MSWRPQRVKSTAYCLDCECIKLRSCCELCSAICPKEQRKPHFCLNARPLVSLSPSIKGAWSCSSQYVLTHPNYQINTSHLKRKKRKQKGNIAKYLPYPSCPGTKAVNYHLYIIPVPGTVLSTLYVIVLFQPYYKAVRKVLLLSSFYSWARGGFPGGSVVKNPPANAGVMCSIPGSGRSPWEGNDSPLQYPCLENPMDRGVWQATVHGITEELDTATTIATKRGTEAWVTEPDLSLGSLTLEPGIISRRLHCLSMRKMKVKEGFSEKWWLNKGLKEGREQARQMPEEGYCK